MSKYDYSRVLPRGTFGIGRGPAETVLTPQQSAVFANVGRIGSTGLSTGPHLGVGPDPEPADDYGQGCEDDPLVEQDQPTGGDE